MRTNDGKLLYVEVSSALASPRGTLLVGVPTFVWSSDQEFVDSAARVRPSPAGVRLASQNTAVVLPPFVSPTTPFTPFSVLDGKDPVVVWATSHDTTRSGVVHQDELWSSSLRADGWSKPDRLWSSKLLTWHSWTASFLARSSGPLAVFPAADSALGPGGGVGILFRAGGRWRRNWLRTGPLPPIGAVAMEVERGQLLLAAIGPIDQGGVDAANALVTIRVPLADTVGSPSFTLLRRFDNATAADPQFYRASDGIHLVWRKKSRVSFAADSLFDVDSRDGGRTWSAGAVLSLDGKFRDLRIARTSDRSTTGVAIEQQTGRMIRLQGDAGSWRITPGPDGEVKTAPTLDVIGDRLLLTFGVARRSAGPSESYEAPVLLTSSRALRCEDSSGGSPHR